MIDVPKPRFGRRIGPWHRWFAWYPVETYDGRSIWMRWIWRAGCQPHAWLDGPLLPFFQYSVEEPSQ